MWTASYSYKTVQASPDTLFIDLAGAKAEGVARSQQWVNPVFSGYKLLPYQDASGQPVVRVQVDTKQASPFVVQKDGSRLRLIFRKEHFLPVPRLPPLRLLRGTRASAHVRPHSAHPPAGPLLVSKVTFDKHESGETFVDVATSRTASYRVMTLPNPARLVVDIEGAQNTSHQKSYAADTAVLKDVRIGQFRAKDPSVVRVVADLNGNPAFDVHATPAGVRIELRPRGVAKSAPLATQGLRLRKRSPRKARPLKTAAVAPAPVAPLAMKVAAARAH